MASKSLSGAMHMLQDLKTISDHTNNSQNTKKVIFPNNLLKFPTSDLNLLVSWKQSLAKIRCFHA